MSGMPSTFMNKLSHLQVFGFHYGLNNIMIQYVCFCIFILLFCSSINMFLIVTAAGRFPIWYNDEADVRFFDFHWFKNLFLCIFPNQAPYEQELMGGMFSCKRFNVVYFNEN